MAIAVEGRGVEIGVGALLRERPGLHLFGGGIDAENRIQPAIGDPRRAVGPDDDAVRRRAFAEPDALHLSRLRVKASENTGTLARVPDAPVGCGRHVMGVIVRLHLEIFDLHRASGARQQDERQAKKG